MVEEFIEFYKVYNINFLRFFLQIRLSEVLAKKCFTNFWKFI